MEEDFFTGRHLKKEKGGAGVKPATSLNFEAYGTINSAGIQIKQVPTNVQSATMQYKKQTESTWKNGLDPVITEGNSYTENYNYNLDMNLCAPMGQPLKLDYCYYIWPVWATKEPMIRRINGSIMYLDANTTYDMKVTMKKSDGSVYQELAATVKTRPDAVAYGSGRTLKVAKSGATYTTISSALTAATAGDTIEVGAGTFSEGISFSKSGDTTKGPITVRGTPDQTIITGGINFSDNVHDIIVETLKMTGSNTKLSAGENTKRITIQNNRFEGAGSNFAFYVTQKNFDWLFQNNIIRGNIWYPVYSERSRGLVFRNNDVRVSSTEDIVSFRAGPRLDTDIYGNYFEGTTTGSGLELEGGVNINVRMWDNTLKINSGERAAASHVPVMVGPIYIFRNTFYGAQQGIKYAGQGLDQAATYDDWADLGPVFYFNNDFHFYGNRWSSYGGFFRFTNISRGNFHLRNNIIYGRLIQTEAIDSTFLPRSGDPKSGQWGIIDTDYNLFWNGSTTTNPNGHHPGVDAHSLFTDPKYTSPSPTAGLPDLHLTSTSPAINKGTVLPNITDNYPGSAPDIGRYEFTENLPPEIPLRKDLPAGWSMFSLPYNPQNPDPIEVFNGIDPGYLSNQLYRFSHEQLSYIPYDEFDPGNFGPMKKDEGYYVWSDPANSKTIIYTPITTDQQIEINLPSAGWYMIAAGNKVQSIIDNPNVQVKNNSTGEIRNFDQAWTAGWIDANLWYYNLNVGNYDLVSADPAAGAGSNIEPWKSYWFNTFVPNLVLIIK